MTDHDDELLRRSQHAIDDAKAAAAEVTEPDENEHGADVHDADAPADGPAPAP